MVLINFFWFKREIGGIALSCFHFLLAIVGVFFSLTEIIELLEKSCDGGDVDCKFYKNVLFGLYLAIDLTCCIWAYFIFKSIEAIKRRKHQLLRPTMAMLIIFIIISFSLFVVCAARHGKIQDHNVMYAGWGLFVFGCLSLCSVAVYKSLYNTFKEEYSAYKLKMDGNNSSSEDTIDTDADSAFTFESD